MKNSEMTLITAIYAIYHCELINVVLQIEAFFLVLPRFLALLCTFLGEFFFAAVTVLWLASGGRHYTL